MAELQQNQQSNSRWLWGLGLAIVCVVMSSTLLAEDEPQSSGKQARGRGASVPRHRPANYEVPAGSIRRLAKFIDDLQTFDPTSRAEDMEYREKAPDALQQAAERLLALHPPEDSPAYLKATGVILWARIPSLADSEPDERRDLIEEIIAHLEKVELGIPEARMAMSMEETLEDIGDLELQIGTYRSLMTIFGEAEDPGLRRLGDQFEGSLRRLDLIGNEMRITGTTMEGDPFHWDDYRGKIVLVDFWATWCPECVAEFQNIHRNYELYHERGFDVVGISLDDQRAELEYYLARHDMPWTILHEGQDSSPTVDYYGISLLPSILLVDAEGKVVSLNALGPELDRLLAEMIGPPEEDPSEEGAGEAAAQESR